MNCARTMERKPSAFAPSAVRPFIPHTERSEQLNTYGDAPLTVSVSIVTVPDPDGSAGRLLLTDGIKYVKVFGPVTVATVVEIL